MLTLDEFRKLPEEEKAQRYCELTDHERFLWRISCPITPRVVKNSELTPQELKYVTRWRKELLEKGEITQKEFDELQNY